MKKLLILLLAVVLAVVLVACGDEPATSSSETSADSTSTTTSTNSTSTSTTTTPKTTTTTTPVTTLYEGNNILYNLDDMDYNAINDTWQGMYAFAFESGHRFNNYTPALVFVMNESYYGIYESLVDDYTDDPTANPVVPGQTWAMNSDYKWVVTIDDVDYTITNFDLLHSPTSGYIRLDLGSTFAFNEDPDHEYDVLLRIYNSQNHIEYWAWFTDPEWVLPYVYIPPVPVVMVEDTNRDATDVLVDYKLATPLAGPQGMNNNETYDLLFDGRVDSKLCNPSHTNNDATTPNETFADPIVWSYEEAIKIASYSLVGANDDADFTQRIPIVFTLYGSNDNSTWTEIDSRDLTPAEGETLVGVNYGERNFKVSGDVAAYKYFKLEIDTTPHLNEHIQMSEIMLYTAGTAQ